MRLSASAKNSSDTATISPPSATLEISVRIKMVSHDIASFFRSFALWWLNGLERAKRFSTARVPRELRNTLVFVFPSIFQALKKA